MDFSQNYRKLAVLIDAENISARYADAVFQSIATIGQTSLRRAFTDFSSLCAQSWSQTMPKYAISPFHVCRPTNGKNVCDLALVINAMDLLHSGRHDGFCIVTSDGDFSGLATRIREQGLDVFGFGEQKAPIGFRQACTHFSILQLNDEPVTAHAAAKKKAPVAPLEISSVETDLEAILQTIVQSLEDINLHNEWVLLSQLGIILKQAGMRPKRLGFSTLSKLIETTDAFDIQSLPDGQIQVRLKTAGPQDIA